MIEPPVIALTDFPTLMYERVIPLSDLHLLRNPLLANNKQKAQEAQASFHHYLNYWRRNGLLPFIEKGKWGKLSFVQLIWIQILESMREFGLPIGTMQNVCDYFFKDAYKDNVPKKNLSFTKKLLEAKQKAKTISDEEKNMLENVKRILANEGWQIVLKYDINYLTNLVIACINEQWLGGILIFPDGLVAEHVNGKYISHKTDSVNPENPHVYLPLKYYLSTFFEESELATMVNPVFLNADEQSVIREIRKGNIKEVRIEAEGGKIKRFDSTINGTISGDKAKEIMKALGIKNYESVTVETRNEKTLSIKKTKI